MAVSVTSEILKILNVIGDMGSKPKSKDGRMKKANDIQKTIKALKRNQSSIKDRASRFILQFPLVVSSDVSLSTLETLKLNLEAERGSDFILSMNNSVTVVDSLSDLVDDSGTLNGIGDLHNNITNGVIGEDIEYDFSPGSVKDFLMENELLAQPMEDLFRQDSLNESTLPPKRSFLISGKTNEDWLKEDASSDKKDEKEAIKRAGLDRAKNSDSRSKLDAYAKRDNSSQPLIISCRRRYVEKGGENKGSHVDIDVTFGIKVISHVISSEDVIYFLSDTTKRSDFLTKIIRFTSGETKLFTDILFNTSKARKMAKVSSSSSKLLRNLNSLYDINQVKKAYASTGKGSKLQPIIPVTSMIVTRNEVEEIRRATGIDLIFSPKAVSKFMTEYMLIEFIVVDEVEDIVYKYNKEQGGFDKMKLSHMFNALSKEIRDHSKTMDAKSAGNFLSKR